MISINSLNTTGQSKVFKRVGFATQCAMLVTLALMHPTCVPSASAKYPKSLSDSPDTISYDGARDAIFSKVGMQYQVERIALLYPDTIVCILFGLGPDRHFRRIQVVFFGPDMDGDFFKNGTFMIDEKRYMFSYEDKAILLNLFIDLHKQYIASRALIPDQP